MVRVELEISNGGVLHGSRDASSTMGVVLWLDQGVLMMDSP